MTEAYARHCITVWHNRDRYRVTPIGMHTETPTPEARRRGRLVPAMTAARETGVPYTSLREAAFRGEIPVVRLGRAWYFERRDLDQWIDGAKERLS